MLTEPPPPPPSLCSLILSSTNTLRAIYIVSLFTSLLAVSLHPFPSLIFPLPPPTLSSCPFFLLISYISFHPSLLFPYFLLLLKHLHTLPTRDEEGVHAKPYKIRLRHILKYSGYTFDLNFKTFIYFLFYVLFLLPVHCTCGLFDVESLSRKWKRYFAYSCPLLLIIVSKIHVRTQPYLILPNLPYRTPA